MEVKLKFHLHENQLKVWENQARYRVLVAGRRFGKTILAATELILAALSHKKALLWYVCPSYRQAKMICWRLLKNLIPKELEVKYNESELSVTFLASGSVIELRGADNEDSLRGAGLDGMVIDEFASIYDNWSVYHEVLRPALADKKGWVLFIGTPKGKDAFWELYMKGVRNEPEWASFQFKTVDNKALPEIVEEVEEARVNTPERYFRQEYEASFEDFVGLIYPEFGSEHIIEPTHIPRQYQRIGAIDPALSGTTAVLKAAIDEDGRLMVYDEYYEQDKRASEVAEAIREDGMLWYIDPASNIKSQQREGHLYSLYDEYADHGIHATNGENSVEAGINRTGEFFKNGNIKIFKTCTNLIWELERYHWSEQRTGIGGEATPKPFKKDDHLVDALRYLVMSRFDKSELKISVTADYWSPWAVMERNKKAKEKHFKYQARR